MNQFVFIVHNGILLRDSDGDQAHFSSVQVDQVLREMQSCRSRTLGQHVREYMKMHFMAAGVLATAFSIVVLIQRLM